MKLAVAQLRPVAGPIETNVARHVALVDLAIRLDAGLIVFPELSLTGYEPALAAGLARPDNDSCFSRFQSQCDTSGVSTGVGFPLRTTGRPRISTLLFQPNGPRRTYSKRFLHIDEEPYFERGTDTDSMICSDPKVALAICYELSIPEHAANAFDQAATAYIASVAKTAQGMEAASARLASLSQQHSAITMLSNCTGFLGGMHCVGGSSAWGRDGVLRARLDSESDGVVVIDCETEEAITETLEA